jgi:hypothetical protein
MPRTGLFRPLPDFKTCTILNIQLIEKMIDSDSSPPNHRHSYGDRECCAPAHELQGNIMPRSSRSALAIRQSIHARWMGVMAAALTAWSFLLWTIWQVSLGLF